MMESSRIIHAAVGGLAPQNATDALKNTIHQSIFFDGHNHIRRASGLKPTPAAHVQRSEGFINEHQAY